MCVLSCVFEIMCVCNNVCASEGEYVRCYVCLKECVCATMCVHEQGGYVFGG